ncbi:MAG: glycerol-3-phosphate 1-O-acyltransferase PlsY [Steroidobacteraceae bacterium]
MTTAAGVDLAWRVVLAYLVGSVIGSLVIGRLAGGVDIRTLGSRNAGGTNALRTQGKWFALGVVIIDVAKGWIAAAWIPTLHWPSAVAVSGAGAIWWPVSCAFAAVLGHVYPLWYGFRGGKGGATLIGALAGLAPWCLVPVLLTWVALVIGVGFVSLGTIVAAAVLPVVIWIARLEPRTPLMTFAVAVAVLVAFTHRANIRRMLAGTEPRARRLWLLGRWRR